MRMQRISSAPAKYITEQLQRLTWWKNLALTIAILFPI